MEALGAKSAAPLFSPQFLQDPYPTYRQHLEGPLVQPLEGLQNRWAVFRYAICSNFLRDPRLSATRPPRMLVSDVPDAGLPEFDDLGAHLNRWLLLLDAPAHTRLRKLMNKGFAPLTIERLRPRIEEIVQRLVQRMESSADPDVVRDVAYPLPVYVISDLLGLPASLHERCITLTNDIAVWFGNPWRTAESARRAQQATRELTGYFDTIIREHDGARGGDLLSLLLDIADDEDQKMTTDELHAQCVMLLFAGHETTRNLIGNGMYTLLTHPEALADLRAESDLVRGAVEEVLRFESPVQGVARITKTAIEIEGVQVPAGASIVFMTAAAQRDPQQFEEPDRFDIRRRHNRHLAFGGDHHVCLGSILARLEGQIAIEALVSRFPSLQLADDRLEWVPNFALRGLRSLRVRL